MLDLPLGEPEFAHFLHRLRIVRSIDSVIQQKLRLALIRVPLHRNGYSGSQQNSAPLFLRDQQRAFFQPETLS